MVEIIPKPIAKPPSWVNILFYFSIVLLIGVISGYFLLNNFIKKSEATLQNLETSLAKEKTLEEQLLEKEIISYQKKIEDVGSLLKEKKFSSKVFGLLERITHPKVSFSSFTFDSAQSLVKLVGSTENFQTLGQQILLLKKEPLIKEINLSEVSIREERKISFTLYLLLDPKFLNYE